MKHFFLPYNLNLPKLVKENPPTFKPFKLDKLAYILHLMNYLTQFNKDLLVDDFTCINATKLQKRIQNYRQYLNYLLYNLRIIECDDFYVPEEKSKGYKFIEHYKTAVVKVEVSNTTFVNTLNRIQNNEQDKHKKGPKYLTKFFNNKLQIDIEAVEKFIAEEFHLKAHKYDLWDYNRNAKRHIEPINQYNHALIGATNFSNGAYYMNRDTNVYRFHSNLTNMRSILRNAVTYNGQNLISLDIKNSQPYFSTLLFQSGFWQIKKGKEELSFCRDIIPFKAVYNTNSTQYATKSKSITIDKLHYKTRGSYIMLGEMPLGLVNTSFQKYINLVLNGELYEYLDQACLEQLGITFKDRQELKSVVFQVLFTDNRFLGQKEAKPKKVFKQLFPEVYEVFRQIKKHDKTVLPRLLQSIESYVMIDVIAKRIAREYPNVPIFTIHDSIATTAAYIDAVERIMNEELAKAVGHAPKLKREYWLKDNMQTYLRKLEIKSWQVA